MRRALACVLLAGWAGLAPSAGEAGEEGGGGPPPVLDAFSYWRSFVMLRPEVYGTSAKDAEIPQGEPRTPPPPGDWAKPEFDDTRWWRAPGPVQGGYGSGREGLKIALVCMRGRFSVDDPARVESLTLSAAYRGGIAVHLNGREVARGHLAEGELAPETMAEAYPWEPYVAKDGKTGIRSSGRVTEEIRERLELRVRRMEKVAIPPKLLRKGVNVLAIELHRAPAHPDSLKIREGWKYRWTTLGLSGLRLEASPAAAVTPNSRRPKGVQVWNAGPLTAIFDLDYGDPNEPLRPIRLAGTRNGSFSGQVVVSSDAPIQGLKAAAGGLKHADGKGAIPAEAVRLRYPQPTGEMRGGVDGRYRGVTGVRRFDALAESPPAEVAVIEKRQRRGYSGPMPVFGAIQPVRVTVRVPAGTEPGAYTGALTIRADGMEPVEVPVELDVRAWKLPEVGDFVTHMGMVQSAETPALYYKVPLWSEKHWALVARSFRLMGEVGNDSLFLPLLARHHFGKEGLVRWVKKADGTFSHDFTIFDRYVDLALEHMGRPEVACLYVWEPTCAANSRYNRKPENKEKQTPPVPLLDPKTGEVTEMPSPFYPTPEAEAFWKPVLDACRERLLKRGVAEKAIMIGMASDRVPLKEEVEAFHRAAPWARWVKHAHGSSSSFHGVPVGHGAWVWSTRSVPDPAKKRYYGWQGEAVMTVFPRTGSSPSTLFPSTGLGECWTLQESYLMAGFRGVARVGADFWPISEKAVQYGGLSLVARYAQWGQTGMGTSTLALLEPGSEGALSTVRLDTIHQGAQEAEARAFLERALLDNAGYRKIVLMGEPPAETHKRLQALLDRRLRIFNAYRDARAWYPSSGWQARSTELYAAAAQVAGALAGE